MQSPRGALYSKDEKFMMWSEWHVEAMRLGSAYVGRTPEEVVDVINRRIGELMFLKILKQRGAQQPRFTLTKPRYNFPSLLTHVARILVRNRWLHVRGLPDARTTQPAN